MNDDVNKTNNNDFSLSSNVTTILSLNALQDEKNNNLHSSNFPDNLIETHNEIIRTVSQYNKQ